MQFAALVRTHAEAIDGAPIGALVREHGAEAVQHAVQAGIALAMTAFAPARRMSGEQIVMFAGQIREEYPAESLADVRLFCRYAASASFDDGQTFGAIDVPMMRRWWTKHLANKADALEVIRRSEAKRAEADWASAAREHPKMIEALKEGERIGKANRPDAEDAVKELARIRAAVPSMSVEELRKAYSASTGQARAIVLAEAKRRGLMGPEAQASQEAYDAREADKRAIAAEVQTKLFAEAGIPPSTSAG